MSLLAKLVITLVLSVVAAKQIGNPTVPKNPEHTAAFRFLDFVLVAGLLYALLNTWSVL